MISDAAMQLMMMNTSSLTAKYKNNSQTKTKHQLPRDYMITSLLIRQFGELAVSQHSVRAQPPTQPAWSSRR